MANFTDNTTQLQSLLAKVNELPEAQNIDTCTVTIILDTQYYSYVCTTCVDGVISPVYHFHGSGDVCPNSITIQNVVCNSAIMVMDANTSEPSTNATGTAEVKETHNGHAVIKAPSVNGENATVELHYYEP